MHRWFHPNLNNVEAERLLVEAGEDGSFLVRPSKSCRDAFSLSVRRKDKVTHIKIKHEGGFYYLHSSDKFATLAELVQHYMEKQVKENHNEVYELKKPLNSSDPITERWFHGSISGAVAERLIKEKGQTGSFLVRESQSQLGDYVLTVRTKDGSNQEDKVTHLKIRHRGNKYDVYGGEKFDSLTELVEHYKQNPMVETKGTVVNMKYPFNATHITASDITARVIELSKENTQLNGSKEGFWEEFEHLQHQECKVLFTRKVGQEERNMLKNRYKNILPYDYTRVILNKPIGNKNNSPAATTKTTTTSSSSSSGDTITNNDTTTTKTDYINANFIKLVEDDTTISPRTKPVPHSKIYIATQGPLPNTVEDFWWMVWQERSDCIVMVTKEVERGKNKCYRYWPTLEQPHQRYGPLEIKILSDTTVARLKTTQLDKIDYVRRDFELRFMGSDENNDCLAIRQVVQYQYYAWPDQNIPQNPTSVINFLVDINRHPPTGPLIVHCSAGIGRSGTLIVIDMLMDQLNHYGLTYEIDIQRIVKIARAQRSGLVQTEAQYKFIYLAIQNYIINRLAGKQQQQSALHLPHYASSTTNNTHNQCDNQ